jgi:hypothetical protein
MDERDTERRYLAKQNAALGWVLLAMALMAVGGLLAQVVFGHHVW